MRTAVFDFDGALADTAPDLVGALNEVMAAEGLAPAPLSAARAMAGRGGRALIAFGYERAGQTLDPEGIEARLTLFLAAYEARIDRETRLFEGAETVLDALAAAGWRLGVCTNKPHAMAVTLLGRLGVLERFHSVIGAGRLPVRKPDPVHVLETIAQAGGDPRRAVMLGDTETDRDAARAAGVPIVLTRFGYSPTPVDALAPDAIIEHFSQLIPVFERLTPAPDA